MKSFEIQDGLILSSPTWKSKGVWHIAYNEKKNLYYQEEYKGSHIYQNSFMISKLFGS